MLVEIYLDLDLVWILLLLTLLHLKILVLEVSISWVLEFLLHLSLRHLNPNPSLNLLIQVFHLEGLLLRILASVWMHLSLLRRLQVNH